MIKVKLLRFLTSQNFLILIFELLLISTVMFYGASKCNYDDFKNLETRLNRQDSLFKELYYSIVDTFERENFLVTLTTYNAEKGQCDNTPDITASHLKIHKKSKYIGLSRDLLETFPYGSLVKIENAGRFNGIYVVADCMNIRLFRHVDILIDNNKHTKLENAILKNYKEGG